MDIFWIPDPDPHDNRCGSSTLLSCPVKPRSSQICLSATALFLPQTQLSCWYQILRSARVGHHTIPTSDSAVLLSLLDPPKSAWVTTALFLPETQLSCWYQILPNLLECLQHCSYLRLSCPVDRYQTLPNLHECLQHCSYLRLSCPVEPRSSQICSSGYNTVPTSDSAVLLSLDPPKSAWVATTLFLPETQLSCWDKIL